MKRLTFNVLVEICIIVIGPLLIVGGFIEFLIGSWKERKKRGGER